MNPHACSNWSEWLGQAGYAKPFSPDAHFQFVSTIALDRLQCCVDVINAARADLRRGCGVGVGSGLGNYHS